MALNIEWDGQQGLWIITAVLSGEVQEIVGKTLEQTRALFRRAQARQGVAV